MQSARVDAGGIRLHWREAGAGPAVVLLHAFPLHSAMWLPQLRMLPGQRHWIAPDVSGFGEARGGGGPLSMERMAEHVAALLDHLGHERATLCGVSMGGYIAFAFLRRWPERVSGLLLSDTRATADDPGGRLARRISSERVRAEGTQEVVTQMLDRLLGETTRRKRPGVKAAVRSMLEDVDPTAFARAQAAMANRPDSTGLLAGIAVPTRVVVGSEDAIIKVDDARALAGAIPGAELGVIEGAGHLPSLECPDEFNAELLKLVTPGVSA